jgi:peptide/nickel transport system ATP-binding protein
MLKLCHVSAQYNIFDDYINAVKDVDFCVKDNEIFGIAGESGCGKSTLLKVMYDLIEYPLKISGGHIELHTQQPDGTCKIYNTGEIRSRYWREISYIPQGAMHVLNPVKKIDIQFYDSIGKHSMRIGKKQLHDQIVSYLKELELPPEVMKAYPHQLSGGMKQRIMIALATFSNPSIILADEPTTALDVVVQRGILSMLSRVQKKTQKSIVIVSHDLGVHYQITHRMGIMYAGEMVEIGPTDEMFNNPKHPYTKMLIESLPRIGDPSQKEGIPGTPPNLKNPPDGCRFAPRCQYAVDLCRKLSPCRYQIGEGHQANCHLLEDKYPKILDEEGILHG